MRDDFWIEDPISDGWTSKYRITFRDNGLPIIAELRILPVDAAHIPGVGITSTLIDSIKVGRARRRANRRIGEMDNWDIKELL